MGANCVAHVLRIHVGMPSGPTALPGLRSFSVPFVVNSFKTSALDKGEVLSSSLWFSDATG